MNELILEARKAVMLKTFHVDHHSDQNNRHDSAANLENGVQRFAQTDTKMHEMNDDEVPGPNEKHIQCDTLKSQWRRLPSSNLK